MKPVKSFGCAEASWVSTLLNKIVFVVSSLLETSKTIFILVKSSSCKFWFFVWYIMKYLFFFLWLNSGSYFFLSSKYCSIVERLLLNSLKLIWFHFLIILKVFLSFIAVFFFVFVLCFENTGNEKTRKSFTAVQILAVSWDTSWNAMKLHSN